MTEISAVMIITQHHYPNTGGVIRVLHACMPLVDCQSLKLVFANMTLSVTSKMLNIFSANISRFTVYGAHVTLDPRLSLFSRVS